MSRTAVLTAEAAPHSLRVKLMNAVASRCRKNGEIALQNSNCCFKLVPWRRNAKRAWSDLREAPPTCQTAFASQHARLILPQLAGAGDVDDITHSRHASRGCACTGQRLCLGGAWPACYKMAYFHHVSSRVDFREAELACRVDGGHLVSIRTPQEQKRIQTLLEVAAAAALLASFAITVLITFSIVTDFLLAISHPIVITIRLVIVLIPHGSCVLFRNCAWDREYQTATSGSV